MYLPGATKVRSYCWPGVAGHLASLEGGRISIPTLPYAVGHAALNPVVLLEAPLQSMK